MIKIQIRANRNSSIANKFFTIILEIKYLHFAAIYLYRFVLYIYNSGLVSHTAAKHRSDSSTPHERKEAFRNIYSKLNNPGASSFPRRHALVESSRTQLKKLKNNIVAVVRADQNSSLGRVVNWN